MRMSAFAFVLLLPSVGLARRDFTAPGPHAVGMTTLTFTKASETTGAPRVLDTVIWYPAVPGTGVAGNGTDARRDAVVARRRWPLVMFSHGSCGFPGQSPFFTAGLASWGFIVAAPPHPGNTTSEFPHCADPPAEVDSFLNRVADIRFVIDQLLAHARDPASPFARRINPRRIGMSGHSFGGQTTLRVAAADSRVRGAVALAPAIVAITDLRIRTPTMVFGGQLDSLTPFETDSRGAFALLQGPRFLVEILNTGHCGFAILCAPLLCGRGCEPGTLPLDEAHRLTLRYAVPFFLRYVAGRGHFGKLLRPAAAPSGEVVVEARPRG